MEIIPVIHIVNDKQVFTNVEICKLNGIKKIFLIDHIGIDRSLPSYSEEIKDKYGLWVGINLLGEDIEKILTRADEWYLLNKTDAIWSDDGLTHFDMDKLMEIDCKNRYEGQFFGGLAFKYQKQPEDLGLACLKSKFITDVSVTSGSMTGSAPTKVKIEEIRKHLGTTHPLAIASGVSVDNIKSFIGLAQYAMVATSITDNKTELIIEKKLIELINKIK